MKKRGLHKRIRRKPEHKRISLNAFPGRQRTQPGAGLDYAGEEKAIGGNSPTQKAGEEGKSGGGAAELGGGVDEGGEGEEIGAGERGEEEEGGGEAEGVGVAGEEVGGEVGIGEAAGFEEESVELWRRD